MYPLSILFCAYGNSVAEYIRPALQPFIDLNLPIGITSCRFENFEEEKNDETIFVLRDLMMNYDCVLDLYEGKIPVSEATARNFALDKLKEVSDKVILIDSDEFWTKQEIENLLSYLKIINQYYTYRVCYKNTFGDGSEYTNDFNPIRVISCNLPEYKLINLEYDNDPIFQGKYGIKSYKDLISKEVPRHVANPVHRSWENNERSRKKIEYQIKHFGNGNPNGCSFKWNDKEKRVEINEEYFRLTKKPLPIFQKM